MHHWGGIYWVRGGHTGRIRLPPGDLLLAYTHHTAPPCKRGNRYKLPRETAASEEQGTEGPKRGRRAFRAGPKQEVSTRAPERWAPRDLSVGTARVRRTDD